MKLVKYYANWCQPCRRFAPVVEKVSKEFNIPLESVNIEEHAIEGISSIPVMRLYDDNDTMIKENIGVMSPVQLRRWVSEELPA